MHEHESEQQGRATRRSPEGGEVARHDRQLAWASLIGNAAVQRLLAGSGLRRSGARQVVDDEAARAIDAKRGKGAELDRAARGELEQSLGHDFSDVRVHADAESAALSRALDAKAFTTGSDVFFGANAYDPGSSAGRELLAHELTHVVQQRGAPTSGELTVSDPNDALERQAHEVATGHTASRALADEEPAGDAELARQEAEEEELEEEA